MSDQPAITHLVLDGLTDPRLARSLSTAWHQAGFENSVDPAGQCAQLSQNAQALTEEQVDGAASVARQFGLEIRDRAGNIYQPEADLDTLRQKTIHEYKSRFATAIVFGLPAMLLHYLSPFLAGGVVGPRSLTYQWLIEMVLVGWMLISAGWPIFWQGALAVRHLRMTGDLFISILVAVAFIPSAWGVIKMPFGVMPQDLPLFHAASMIMTLALLNRWQGHRAAANLAGRGDLMVVPISLIFNLWLLASLWFGLGFAMLLPGCVGLASVNRRNPGLLTLLPIFGFVGVWLLGPSAMELSMSGMEIEIAGGFGLLLSGMFALNWRASF